MEYAVLRRIGAHATERRAAFREFMDEARRGKLPAPSRLAWVSPAVRRSLRQFARKCAARPAMCAAYARLDDAQQELRDLARPAMRRNRERLEAANREAAALGID